MLAEAFPQVHGKTRIPFSIFLTLNNIRVEHSASSLTCSDLVQRLLKVGGQVVHVLQAQRDAD